MNYSLGANITMLNKKGKEADLIDLSIHQVGSGSHAQMPKGILLLDIYGSFSHFDVVTIYLLSRRYYHYLV